MTCDLVKGFELAVLAIGLINSFNEKPIGPRERFKWAADSEAPDSPRKLASSGATENRDSL